MSWTTTSFAEGYLKPEPLHEDNMFNEMDCEFFQDLVQWCPESTKAELPAIDPPKKREETSHNTDTLHTTFSPQSWDVIDAISPGQAGLYSSTPNDPLSPNMDELPSFNSKFLYNCDTVNESKIENLNSNLDILNLPVVIGDIASEEMIDLNPQNVAPFDYYNVNTTHHTEYTPTINTHKMFLHDVDEEDSFDMKLGSVVMGEVENHVMVFNNEGAQAVKTKPRQQLSLNVAATPAQWSNAAINTPDILSYVEQLETEKYPPVTIPTQACPSPDTGFNSISSWPLGTTVDSSGLFEPASPKSETRVESDVDDASTCKGRKRKRRSSEDSDETYTPYKDEVPRKKGRRPNILIKDMIQALEESQQVPKARRGRPPKRRESNVSSACSMEDNDNTSCASIHEFKYRVLRDKNNEASKRSRMSRKLKELKMEQLAIELEERNKKLKVKADILEDMTKRLKDALMTAIIQKQ